MGLFSFYATPACSDVHISERSDMKRFPRFFPLVVGALFVVLAAPADGNAQSQVRDEACALLRSRSRSVRQPVDRAQRAAREREIRACITEMPTAHPAAWRILRERDPRIFRSIEATDIQVDGVTQADILTAFDAAEGRQAARAPVRSLVPGIMLMAGMGIVALLYFVPTIVALVRGHHNKVAIFALNLFLGWSVLGWVGALVWSLTVARRTDPGSQIG